MKPNVRGLEKRRKLQPQSKILKRLLNLSCKESVWKVWWMILNFG